MNRWMFIAVFEIFGINLTLANKHYIYWDSFSTPDLLKGKVQQVKIGEFLDILCPQTSLMGITNGPSEPEVFNLYNVSKYEYSRCSTKGKEDLVFTCNKPDKENKLTIKFQTFSPSPYGFRFQYCQDYYIIAKSEKNLKGKYAGCHENSTRLRISVACKEEPTDKTKTTTTTTKTTTTTLKPTTSTLAKSTKEKIHHPDVKPLSSKAPDHNGGGKTEKVYGGGAISRKSNFTLILTISAFLNFVARHLNT